jgi:hypothetical protein
MAYEYGSTQIGGGTSGAISGAASGAMAGAALGPVGMIGGAILGGIFGSKSVSAPKPPTYGGLMQNTLNAQKSIQKKLIGLEGKYRPLWQNLTESTYNQQLYGGGDNQGYLSMLEELQGKMLGLQEQAVMGNMSMQARLAAQARDQMLSPEQQAIRQSITGVGMNALAAGRNLTPEQVRESQQAARAAMTARGLGGRQGVAAEVLNRSALADARESRNLQLGASALQLESGIQDMAIRQAMSGQGLLAGSAQFMGASNMLGDYTSKVFQPESQMAAQLAGAQYQAGMANAQSELAGRQQMLQSLGSLGSFAAMNPGMFSFGSTPSGLAGPGSFNPNAGLGANPQFGMVGSNGNVLPMSPAYEGSAWGIYGS